MIQAPHLDPRFTSSPREPVIFNHMPHAIWTLSAPSRRALAMPRQAHCQPWLSPLHLQTRPRRLPLRPQFCSGGPCRPLTLLQEVPHLPFPTCLHSATATALPLKGLARHQPQRCHAQQILYISDRIPSLHPQQAHQRQKLRPRRPHYLRRAPLHVILNPGVQRKKF